MGIFGRKPREIETGDVIAFFNQLSPVGQVVLFRAIGEALLREGNSLETLIAGMPYLEAAVHRSRIEILKRPASRQKQE